MNSPRDHQDRTEQVLRQQPPSTNAEFRHAIEEGMNYCDPNEYDEEDRDRR